MKTYDLKVGDKSYKVDVEHFDGKRAVVKVDGKPFSVDVEKGGEAASPAPPVSPPPSVTPGAAPAPPQTPVAPEPPTPPVASAPQGGQVIAPMPGMILEVMVSVGDTVSAGTPVVKMEAMKMENEIPAPVNGTVKEIMVKVGDRVATDETLLVID
ncbi:MAG: biotin/lipoyl-containing protein [Thermodesulfobacteriota bacterium]|nr:biotin/lipoyl-containing protein [Thermodesulfobacteriota bacterium]